MMRFCSGLGGLSWRFPIAFVGCLVLSLCVGGIGCNAHSEASVLFAGSKEEIDVWRNAFLATCFITLGGNVVIVLLVYKKLSERALNVLLAFAAGSLLGDALLHLLPHSMPGHGHSHSHSHSDAHTDSESDIIPVGLVVVSGVATFFLIELSLRTMSSQFGISNHGHSHGSTIAKDKSRTNDISDSNASNTGGIVFIRHPSVILNLTGDFLHNFTDGISVAAAFQVSHSLGMSVMVTMILHEIPHEIGDYALLVSQGLSNWAALKAQFVSAIGAFAGCFIGLYYSQIEPALVLAFTAGGFLYISLCSTLPQLLESGSKSLFDAILHVGALLFGVYVMQLISLYEADH